MSNLFKKVAAGISSVAVAASMLVPSATLAAPMAGDVYKTTDGTVWFITKDMKKVPFTSWGAYQTYGFLAGQAIKDADASVTALPTGDFVKPRDGSIFCATETKASDVKGECAFISGGKKASFTSEAVFSGQGFSFSRAMYGDSSFLEKGANIDSASAAHRPGTLINDNGTYKLVVSGGTWGIPSPAVLTSWGYSFSDAVMANTADKALSQTGVIPTRVAGELVPSASAGGVSPVSGTLKGEGTVETFDIGSADQTDISEGQEDVELVAFDLELSDDGDLQMDRFDLYMQQSGDASNKPWDYFSDVTVKVNGKEVASMSVDSSSDWYDTDDDCEVICENGNNGNEYRLRFGDLASFLASDETSTVTVEFSANSVIDSEDEDAVWQYGISDDSFRFTDGTGYIFTDGDEQYDNFTFEGADEAELDISSGNDDPDATLIEVSKSSDTNGVTIGEFDIEETEDVDVNITEIAVNITTSDDEEDVYKKLYLYDGSTKVGEESVTGSEVVFDNIDLDVDGDDTVTLTVKADFRDTDDGIRYAEGTTIAVTSVDINEFTDEYDNDQDDLTVNGDYASETHELRTEGMRVEFVSASESFINNDAVTDQATYTIKMNVTAFGEDIYLDKDADNVGFTLDATDGGDPDGSGATLSASGTGVSTEPNSFKILEGKTASVTFKITATPDLDSSVRAWIDSLGYGFADGALTETYDFNMGEDGDFITDYVYLDFVA